VDADLERLWVQKAASGDEEAFSRLVEAYQRPVYNLAYRMLGNGAEAEDAAQETFLRVYKRLDTYDPKRKFSSWILSIASHHCIDRLRRRRGDPLSTQEIKGSRWIPDPKPKPEERSLANERDAEIRALLEELPTQYRLVIVLRYWQDLSYDDMAQITGATVSAVKSRLHRARKMMASKVVQAKTVRSAGQASERRVPENALSESV